MKNATSTLNRNSFYIKYGKVITVTYVDDVNGEAWRAEVDDFNLIENVEMRPEDKAYLGSLLAAVKSDGKRIF